MDTAEGYLTGDWVHFGHDNPPPAASRYQATVSAYDVAGTPAEAVARFEVEQRGDIAQLRAALKEAKRLIVASKALLPRTPGACPDCATRAACESRGACWPE